MQMRVNCIDSRKTALVDIAFGYYREHGFPYPKILPHELLAEFFRLEDSRLKTNELQQVLFADMVTKEIEITNAGLSICNYFNPQIWETHACSMRSPIAAFGDDRALRKSIRLAYETTGKITDTSVRNKLKIVNGTQMCSNFRPSAAKAIYEKFYRFGDVLDPSMGYGGRLLGFMASALGCKYIGVDPEEKTCNGNLEMARFFDCEVRTEFICSPFEDLIDKSINNEIGFVFTSPPYFRKEIYSENPNQSCHRYINYSDWLRCFWQRTIEIIADWLLPGGTYVVNIQNVRIKTKQYNLVDDTLTIASKLGLMLSDRLSMRFSGYGANLAKFKKEEVLVFTKDWSA